MTSEGQKGTPYIFKVEQAWKGVDANTFTIHTWDVCGVGMDFEIGQRYLILTAEYKGWFPVSASNSVFPIKEGSMEDKTYGPGEILNALGRPKVRFDEENTKGK